MQKVKGIYDYLAQTRVLEWGDEAAIKAAKKMYWRQYRTALKREQRKEHQSYTVLFTNKEARQVQAMAKAQQTSPTSYIKLAALTTRTGLSRELTGTIRQLLYQCYSDIEAYMEENEIQEVAANKILEKITTLEKQIIKIVQSLNCDQ
ncbi:MAG: hypothetical protein JST86_09455 [Bacteroidetes bacterium]|nr:hypothetical protein [Bacteroidota bacterium]